MSKSVFSTRLPSSLLRAVPAFLAGIFVGAGSLWLWRNAEPPPATTQRVIDPRLTDDNPRPKAFVQAPLALPAPPDSEILTRQVAELENALAARDRKIARQEEQMRFLQDVSGYLLTGTGLEIPQGVAETSIFAGQLHRQAAEFRQKWGENGPNPADPSYADYQQERDALAKDYADLAKAINEMNLPAVISEPKRLAEFQSLQVYSALELDSTTWTQMQAALARNYEAGFQRKLNGANRPSGDTAGWEAERNALAAQAYQEVLGILPSEKRAGFERFYGPDFFWTIQITGM